MKNLVIISAACLALALSACDTSQVVDFPEASSEGSATGGSSNVNVGGSGGIGGVGGAGGVGAYSSSSCPEDPCLNVVCYDENCPGGQVCVDNKCTPVDPCDGVVCPVGSVCEDGCCVSLCEDVECPSGSSCENGECIPGDPCEDVDCCEDEVCVDGECVEPDPCDGVECPEGKECHWGYCVCDGEDDDSCGPGKTELCHFPPGNWWNKHTICVGNAAVPAHLDHGDKLGECNND